MWATLKWNMAQAQPQGHVQILVNMIDLAMNVQEAGDAARFVHGGSSQPTGGGMTDGGYVRMESGVSEAVVRELRKRGHSLSWGERHYVGSVGGYQAVWRDPETGVYHGGTEMRFDGAAADFFKDWRDLRLNAFVTPE